MQLTHLNIIILQIIMNFNKISLRIRLFVAMVLLIVLACIVIASITILRFKQEAQDYHSSKLKRKELAIKQHIDFILRRTTYPISAKNLPLILKEKGKIFELSEVHQMPINFYDLEGNLLIKSNQSFVRDTIPQGIPSIVISQINATADKRFLVQYDKEGERFQSAYSYITDQKFKPLAILNLPYLQNDSAVKKDINAFLKSMIEVCLIMIFASIGLAYIISNYITQSITSVSEKIKKTRIDKLNKKIEAKDVGIEIKILVDAYNDMIDQLEQSAVKLAKSERENAWREMARQVAHEIKNPLTPMRLTIQNFERKFDPTNPNIQEKLKEHTNTLLEQIDIMSTIASAFSNFAKMPARNDEILNLAEIISLGLEIFQEHNIKFKTPIKPVIVNFDRTQLIRVITNLIKNALQAVPDERNPKIEVKISEKDNAAEILVADNGTGITIENQRRIFEPNFTTKTSGMGLGLAMVKSILETYEGTITFETKPNLGTTFRITIPTIKEN